MKINYFTDLYVWQKSHLFVLELYNCLSGFPKIEQYGLCDQMRRASVSITSNIAEGFSRKGNKEKKQFYFLAKGSLTEIQNQLLLSRDLKYINLEIFSFLYSSTIEIHKMLNGLIKSLDN